MGTVTQGALSDLGTVQNADAMTVMGYDARRIQQYELRELALWDVAWMGNEQPDHWRIVRAFPWRRPAAGKIKH